MLTGLVLAVTPATRPSAFGSDGVRSAASHSPERKQSE